MPVTLPDASKFDSDSDTIKESRPELKKMADAINTIGAEYNAGTLGGGDLIDDANPTLGANLDLNNFIVTNESSAGGDITIRAGSGGDIYLDSNNVYLGDGITGAIIESVGQTPLTLGTNKGAGSSVVRIYAPSSGADIELRTASSGEILMHGPVVFEEHTGTPSNTSTPVSWLKVKVVGDSGGQIGAQGETYYIPLHQ